MKIQDKDLYHGAALTQIVEDPTFKALNKTDPKYGQYTVNSNRHLFIKYRTNRRSPWRFTFQSEEAAAIRSAIKRGKTFICLVCGSSTICCLNQDELTQLIDLEAQSTQSIRVTVPPGGSLHVTGTTGDLQRTIPHNAFPSKVLA